MATDARLSADDFLGLADSLDPERRFELIDGRIVEMSPLGPIHVAVVTQLSRELRTLLAEKIIREDSPIELRSETGYLPRPDIAVVSPRADNYASGHPTSDDAELLVEISHSETARRVESKLNIYKRAGIRSIWHCDITERSITVFERTTSGTYDIRRYSGDEIVTHSALSIRIKPSWLYGFLP